MRVKEESEKASLKLNIQKTKIMASGPITSWQIDGETMETDFIKQWQTLFSWAPKSLQMVTAVKKLKDAYDKARKHIETQRHHFASKGLYSQSYGFSCSYTSVWVLDHKEGWAPKNWCFKLWCWRRLLRVPWTGRRSNELILTEINSEYSLEGLMLKLKLQYLGHLIQRPNSLEKTWCRERLKAGGEGDDRQWNGWTVSLTQWTWVWANSGRWWRTGKPGVLQSMDCKGLGLT